MVLGTLGLYPYLLAALRGAASSALPSPGLGCHLSRGPQEETNSRSKPASIATASRS